MEIPDDKDIELMDKIFQFEYGQRMMKDARKKTALIKELGITKPQYKRYVNDIADFRDLDGKHICNSDHSTDNAAYLMFNDESTNIFLDKYGSFRKYYDYKIKKEGWVKDSTDEYVAPFPLATSESMGDSITDRLKFLRENPTAMRSLADTILEKHNGTNAYLQKEREDSLKTFEAHHGNQPMRIKDVEDSVMKEVENTSDKEIGEWYIKHKKEQIIKGIANLFRLLWTFTKALYIILGLIAAAIAIILYLKAQPTEKSPSTSREYYPIK